VKVAGEGTGFSGMASVYIDTFVIDAPVEGE